MPLYDFRCADGHVTEALVARGVAVAPCRDCGEEAQRVAVSPVAFAIHEPEVRKPVRGIARKGERVANYLEAYEEVEDRAKHDDNPEIAVLERETRPAYYRARARLASDGKDARYKPGVPFTAEVQD